MNESSQNSPKDGAAFQKVWLESMSKLMQAAFTFSPDSTPPEVLREIRNNVLQTLGEGWNEYLRSPEFQESMKQWMENAIAFRQITNDFMARVRKEMQAPSRDDVEAIQQNVQHLETRLLERMEALAKQIEELNLPSDAHKPATGKTDAHRNSRKFKNQRPGKARKT